MPKLKAVDQKRDSDSLTHPQRCFVWKQQPEFLFTVLEVAVPLVQTDPNTSNWTTPRSASFKQKCPVFWFHPFHFKPPPLWLRLFGAPVKPGEVTSGTSPAFSRFTPCQVCRFSGSVMFSTTAYPDPKSFRVLVSHIKNTPYTHWVLTPNKGTCPDKTKLC